MVLSLKAQRKADTYACYRQWGEGDSRYPSRFTPEWFLDDDPAGVSADKAFSVYDDQGEKALLLAVMDGLRFADSAGFILLIQGKARLNMHVTTWRKDILHGHFFLHELIELRHKIPPWAWEILRSAQASYYRIRVRTGKPPPPW